MSEKNTSSLGTGDWAENENADSRTGFLFSPSATELLAKSE